MADGWIKSNVVFRWPLTINPKEDKEVIGTRLANQLIESSPLEIIGGLSVPPFLESVPVRSDFVHVCRVLVKNAKSPCTIYRVRVKLENIDPRPPDLPGLPFTLIQMNDRPPYKDTVDLNFDDPRYFDVISLCDSKQLYGFLQFENIVTGINRQILHHRNAKFVITVCASGNEVLPARRKFRCGWRDGRPFLEDYTDPLGAGQLYRKL
jgi:hypothetical protein